MILQPESISESWRLEEPERSGVDAVDAALAVAAATLSYGPHSFDFAKTRTATGDVLLKLSHRADSRCKDKGRVCGFTWLNGLTSMRVIAAGARPDGESSDDEPDSEAGRVAAAGRALFADVARLIRAAEQGPKPARTSIRPARR